jgi:hypothetical protein
MKVKRPSSNVLKKSCVICTEKDIDRASCEFSPDWFKYMCKPCMEEHAEKCGIDLYDEEKGTRK